MSPFGQMLRAARTNAGMSLCGLAKRASFDTGYLSKVERGLMPVADKVAAAYARVLGVDLPSDGVGSVFHASIEVQEASPMVADVPSDVMKRRTLMASGVTVALASFGGAADMPGEVGHVGSGDADRITRAVIRIRTLGHQHGGAAIWRSASSLARDGYHLLEQGVYSTHVGNLILAATGKAQMCAGWLAFDSGRQNVARTCYNEALALARQADSPSVEVHALANLAFQSSFLGMPRQALRYADAAERVASAFDSVGIMTVVPHIRQATAYAIAGDGSQASRALTKARNKFDKASEERNEDWCSFVSSAELDGIEATTALLLGNPQRAERFLVLAVGAYDDRFARNRALYRVRLAKTRVDLHEVEGAGLAANEALDDLSGEVASWVVGSELDVVARLLSRYPEVDEAARFAFRYAHDRRTYQEKEVLS